MKHGVKVQNKLFPWCEVSPCGIWVVRAGSADKYHRDGNSRLQMSAVKDCWVRFVFQYIAEVKLWLDSSTVSMTDFFWWLSSNSALSLASSFLKHTHTHSLVFISSCHLLLIIIITTWTFAPHSQNRTHNNNQTHIIHVNYGFITIIDCQEIIRSV